MRLLFCPVGSAAVFFVGATVAVLSCNSVCGWLYSRVLRLRNCWCSTIAVKTGSCTNICFICCLLWIAKRRPTEHLSLLKIEKNGQKKFRCTRPKPSKFKLVALFPTYRAQKLMKEGGEEWETKGFTVEVGWGLVKQGWYVLVGRITTDRMTCVSKSSDYIWGSWKW